MKSAIFISEADCRAIMQAPNATTDAISAVEHAIASEAIGELEHFRAHISDPAAPGTETGGRSLRTLPAIGGGLGAAVRVYTTNKVDDPFRPAPCELILLFDERHLALRAVVEDYSLHGLRTAAATGVATRYLARPNSERIAVLGTGRQAHAQLAVVASVRWPREVRVFGRDPERRRVFCEEMMRLLECPVRSCDDPAATVGDADIVIAATNPQSPVVYGDSLRPGMHVNSIAPGELDELSVLRSRIFPSSTEDILNAQRWTWSPFQELVREGRLDETELANELGDVVAGRHPGRQSPEEITAFISLGNPSWDLAIAAWVDRRARELGLGRELLDNSGGQIVSGYLTPVPTPPNGST